MSVDNIGRFLVLSIFCLGLAGCSAAVQDNTQAADNKGENFLTVCQVKSALNQYNDKIVTIQGDLEGFHGFRLSAKTGSPDCGSIDVQLDGLQVQELLKDRVHRQVGLIKGELIVEGRLRKDGKEIMIPIDVLEPKSKQIETKMGYRTVDTLEEPKIISFKQTFDE